MLKIIQRERLSKHRFKIKVQIFEFKFNKKIILHRKKRFKTLKNSVDLIIIKYYPENLWLEK